MNDSKPRAMTMAHLPLAILIPTLLFGGMSTPVCAGTVAGTGGATEITQLLNHGELLTSVAKQADMVMEQVNSKLIQIDQLARMNANLQRLASGDVAGALAPYSTQLRTYQSLRSSIGGLKSAADSTRSMLEGRGVDFSNSGAKDLATYLKYETALASRKGGIYRDRLNQDLQALDNLQQRSQELTRVAASSSDIVGNVQGLQRLTQLSAMSAGEMMELKSAVLSQNAELNRQQAEAMDNSQLKSGFADSALTGARGRIGRDTGLGDQKLSPLKSWGGLQQTQ